MNDTKAWTWRKADGFLAWNGYQDSIIRAYVWESLRGGYGWRAIGTALQGEANTLRTAQARAERAAAFARAG